MYLIISYDVESDYCNKILKILRKYLFHVHNSVFEGELTDKQKKELENQLNSIIKNNTSSSIIFYSLPSSKPLNKEIIGKKINNKTII